jgi:hypothetical protein
MELHAGLDWSQDVRSMSKVLTDRSNHVRILRWYVSQSEIQKKDLTMRAKAEHNEQ